MKREEVDEGRLLGATLLALDVGVGSVTIWSALLLIFALAPYDLTLNVPTPHTLYDTRAEAVCASGSGSRRSQKETYDPPKPCSDEVRLSSVPSFLRPPCSVGLYASPDEPDCLPPLAPSTCGSGPSEPPKPCSEETRLSGVPSCLRPSC